MRSVAALVRSAHAGLCCARHATAEKQQRRVANNAPGWPGGPERAGSGRRNYLSVLPATVVASAVQFSSAWRIAIFSGASFAVCVSALRSVTAR